MKDLIKITLGNILITASYAFITVPNHMVNGGLTSFSMILNHWVPLSITTLVNLLSILLLTLAYFYLGREFLMKSLYSSLCYMLFFSLFSSLSLVLFTSPLLCILFAGLLVGTGYFLCIDANSSAVSFDIAALILHQKNEKFDVAVTMRVIKIIVILFGLASYGVTAVLYGICFTLLETEVLHILLKAKKKLTAGNSPDKNDF